MNQKTKILGLIGFPLEHSFSERYFNNRFREEGICHAQYANFPLESIEEFPGLIEMEPDLCGLNVTSPHKKSVMEYLDNIDPVAEEIGAVNTITITKREAQKFLTGYNTDIYGFEKSLVPLLEAHHNRALILGSGGAANAVQYVLKKLGIQYSIVTRTVDSEEKLAYEDLTQEIIDNHKLIINCTPLGMYPHTHLYPPIPYQYLSDKHLAYDLIYNPEKTVFMDKAEQYGCKTSNGLQMLYLQAEKAWEIFKANKCF